jgi:hypothetical protein
MFDLFAVPQRGMPYVQIGLRIVSENYDLKCFV